MDKKLPNIFKNKINKKMNNNNKVFYSQLESKNINEKEKKLSKIELFNNDDSVTTKVNKLFNSNKYIFNVQLLITTKDKKYNTRLAGKMGNVLVTTDNDVISIYDIVDIKTI